MNENLEIIPKSSIGPFRLGMNQAKYQSLLGNATSNFKRTEDSTNTILTYDKDFIHLEINTKGNVVVVSAFQPLKVFLKGVQLLGRSLEQVHSELLAAGFTIEQNDVGIWCGEASVNIVAVDEIVDGVEIYK